MGRWGGFFRRWGRELMVLLLAILGGLIGSSTAIFAAVSFGGGWGLLVLIVGRGFGFLLDAGTYTASTAALIEQIAIFAEGVLALTLFSVLYKKTKKIFLAGLPWMLLLGVAHGIFKAVVLDLPMQNVTFIQDKVIVFVLISTVVAFCDVFIAFMANLFLEELMYKIDCVAGDRKRIADGEDQPVRWR